VRAPPTASGVRLQGKAWRARSVCPLAGVLRFSGYDPGKNSPPLPPSQPNLGGVSRVVCIDQLRRRQCLELLQLRLPPATAGAAPAVEISNNNKTTHTQPQDRINTATTRSASIQDQAAAFQQVPVNSPSNATVSGLVRPRHHVIAPAYLAKPCPPHSAHWLRVNAHLIASLHLIFYASRATNRR